MEKNKSVKINKSKKMLAVLDGKIASVPPLWLMRQAGRYLPEYREVRARAGSFLDLCYNPALAAEVTMQPIRRFGFDAAIIFSDILVIPDALGQKVTFETGEGPRLKPIEDEEGINELDEMLDLEKLSSVFEALGRVRSDLPDDIALIGFCGAPWTVASYMIAGRGSSDQHEARLFAYRHPELFQKLIDKITDASILYLCQQLSHGAELVQIFDSWSGVLPSLEFTQWCEKPVLRLIKGVRESHPEAKIIHFPRGSSTHIPRMVNLLDANAIGLDTAVDLDWLSSSIDKKIPVQGNLDPIALLAGGQSLELTIDNIIKKMKDRPYIFNLGHGILPETPISHVEKLVKKVRMEE